MLSPHYLNMQVTMVGVKTMGDLLATPFLLIGSASMWIASLINGRLYILMEVSEDDTNGDQNGN